MAAFDQGLPCGAQAGVRRMRRHDGARRQPVRHGWRRLADGRSACRNDVDAGASRRTRLAGMADAARRVARACVSLLALRYAAGADRPCGQATGRTAGRSGVPRRRAHRDLFPSVFSELPAGGSAAVSRGGCMTRTLVFGGARSGKSAHAEALAAASGKPVIYIATAQAGDGEMSARIVEHRRRRDPSWRTVEEPIALGARIAECSPPGNLVLVDCLTLWLTNLLFSGGEAFPEVGEIPVPPAFDIERAALLSALKHAAGDLILVSNEVGMGIVPMGAVSRWFVDQAGWLNQAVAARCDRVAFVAAGLP